jgi:hypothetical protein
VNDPTLFPLPANPVISSDGIGATAKGHRAVALLIARLLEIGHKIATPVVDDDGVDLIVNYRITVQVLAMYVIPDEAWWHIPRYVIGGANSVAVRRDIPSGPSEWYEAWSVYDPR